MQILQSAKIIYLISLQFNYTKQTKKTFFENFNNYLNDRHFTANGYQNVIFCKKVEIWKKLKNGKFFSKKFFAKSHFNIGTMKIPKMTK